MDAIKRAIELAGGPAKLAEVLGVSQQAVYFWRAGARRLPAERCPDIERAVGGAVTCEELRPDVDWQYIRGSAVPASAERAA